MQSIGKNQREITIKSNEDWTVRVASKLFLGKGKWEVSWSGETLKIKTSQAYLTQLVRALTTSVIRYGMEQAGNQAYPNPASLWHIWKKDVRFTDMLMTDECIETIQKDILTHLQAAEDWDLSEWVNQNPCFTEMIKSIALSLEEEGKVAGKLQENGWV